VAVITPSRRVRSTPFTPGVEAAGVKAYTVYNHMLLPSRFTTFEEDCTHLKNHVQVWDVACERQVALEGPDARRLLQLLTPRDLTKLSLGRCMYVPVVDQNGGMLNDPVALQIDKDTYWISIADSDLILWVKAVALANELNVKIYEPDVSPLGVQGPKAEDLMARVFGEAVRDIGFYSCARFGFEDTVFTVARSGYSKQGGFEIYVEGHEYGMPLWETLFDAGEDLQVRAGCPNLIERIESGLLSYGNDMTAENTPLECGLGRFVSQNQLEHCYGGQALAEEIAAGGPIQQIRAFAIEGEIPPCVQAWPIYAAGQYVGQVTSAINSPDFQTNVAIGMVAQSHWNDGTAVEVETDDGMRPAMVREKFWN